VLESMDLDIPYVAVVKDERHKPKSIEGDETYKDMYKQEILLTNSESHRFAVSYHTQLRNKDFLKIKDGKRKGKTK
jgi:excinuclease UvrABC nuclease subunit